MIRNRAIVVGAVPLAFLLLLLGLAFVLQARMEQSAAWSTRSEQVIEQAERAIKTLDDANRAVVSYSLKHDPAQLVPYRAAQRALPQQLAQLERMVDDPGQRMRALRLRRAALNGSAVISEYLRYLRSGQTAQAKALGSSARTRQIGASLQSSYEAFNNAQRAAIIAHFNAVRGGFQGFGLMLVLCSLAGILVTLLVSGRFGLHIAQRLERLGENARRLASGEETAPIGGHDEIAALDHVYHEMTQRIQREHHVASTLQRVLLPREVPTIPGLRIDTAYAPAARGTEIGGDWYDVFPLSEQRIAISVGDVAGHGLRAAAVMGAARFAIRAAARIESNPAEILRHTNRVLCADEPEVIVTTFLGVLDLSDGTLTYSIAGHPAPIVVRPGGSIETLSGEGLVLGIDPRRSFEEYETQFEVGSAIVLYTDGVVEAERDYFKGMHDLVEAVRAEHLNASENIAEAIQRRVFSKAQAKDDSAVMFIGVTALGAAATAPQRRTWQIDARIESATRRVKRALLWHLGGIIAPDSDLSGVELILGELVSNVARHTPGFAELTLEYGDRRAILHVCDRGTPFAANGNGAVPDLLAESGRGLFLIKSVAQDVTIEHTGEGNRISALLPVDLQ